MKALVLGASGFLGRWLARDLYDAELYVSARDRSALAAIQREYGFAGETLELDALDAAALARALSEIGPDVVFNAIGYGVDRSERDEALAERINTELPAAIAGLLRPPQILVHAGSALEYGAIGGDLRESSACNPTTVYGRTKLAGTERLRQVAVQAGLQSVTARLFTIYGPGEHEGRLLPTLLAAARSEGPLDFTAGTQRRDFTYVDDAARAMIDLARARIGFGDVVNVATGTSCSVREFIETAMRVLGVDSQRIRFGTLPTRVEEMAHDPVAVSRLASLISWVPRSTPEQGIRASASFGHTLNPASTH